MNQLKSILPVVCLMLFALISCQPAKKQWKPEEGFIEINGGKIWYKIEGRGEGTPLLLLHGGPGFSSHYLNPMGELGKDRPIIFLDQLGSGRSFAELDTSQMTIENFVDQMNEFKTKIGLEEYILYGHSWGTMLGLDFYSKYPEGIQAIVFASPLFSTASWSRDAKKLIQQLPDSIQMAIRVAEEQDAFDTPEFLHAMDAYYQAYVARKLPWDANLDSTFLQMNAEIYNHMWGPSEFKSLGTLKNFDRLEVAKDINVPTLFICGEYDEAQPETVKQYASLVPNAKFEVVKNAAHILTHDNPEQHNQVVGDFLKGVDIKR